ncbi:hypothetical protein JFT91_25460 [Pseudomonas sp. TH08]|uniref:hypothetical protein n=1 Tax=unclassified Pseudomonas TaxID=196821 RepID=UPI001913CE3C|nr:MULTISPECIES: hypothetical protein [unclassified Pseudomonas]MBK5525501.1 hypothetical protein [Pseudomonas sp. TH06]MBK5535885.1 hypothetical protein [Pseudomonas sp. TH08]
MISTFPRHVHHWVAAKEETALFFCVIFQTHAEGVLAGGAITGDALSVCDPSDYFFPRYYQHLIGFTVDVAKLASLAIEANWIFFSENITPENIP